MRERVQRFLQWVRRVLTEPVEELSRAQRAVRYCIDLSRLCWRQMERDRAMEMAAALAYRTIFSLVPLVVLALVMFRAFGGLDQLNIDLEHRVYDFFGLHIVEYEGVDERVVVDDAGEVVGTAPPAEKQAESESAQTGAKAGSKSDSSPSQDNSPPSTATTQSASPPAPPAAEQPRKPGLDGEQLVDPDAEPPDEIKAVAEQAAEEAKAARPPEPTPEAVTVANDADDPKAKARLAASVRNILHTISHKIADQNFAGLGVVGFALLVWAVLALLRTIEESFNLIYNCPRLRPWRKQVIVYWSIITLGPLILMSGATLAQWIATSVESIHWASTLLRFASTFLSLGFSWLLLFLMYALMPNTRVDMRAAAIGSLTSAILWELAKWAFGLYVSRLLPYSAFYGSLGLIPLFLFWLWIGWMIVLFGIELAYTLQTMAGGRHWREEDKQASGPVLIDPRWTIPVMTIIGKAFNDGRTMLPGEIAQKLNLSARAVDELVRRLADADLLNRVEEANGFAYALAKPPDHIHVSQLLDIAAQMTHSEDHEHPDQAASLLNALNRAQREMAGQQTIEDLIADSRSPQN